MKSTTRFVYGLLSSLLLAVGFVRAADRLDPTNNSRFLPDGHDSVGMAPPCIFPCEIASRET